MDSHRVDINSRLVVLLHRLHAENTLSIFRVCLVEVRRGHDDGGS